MDDVAADTTACAIHVSAAAPAWRAAVDEVSARLGTGDCRSIDVRVGKDGAAVIFIAADGRVAVRKIDAPSELSATIDALRISLPAATSPASATSPAETAAAIEPVAAAPTVATAPTNLRAPVAAPPSSPPRLVVALYGGARLGWPRTFISPLLGTAAALGISSWQIGIYGEWETGYSSRAAPLPSGYQMSAYAAGVSVGPLLFDRRLALELRLGGAVVSEEGSEAVENTGGDRAEARVGIAAHSAIPFRSSVRARGGFGFELSPTGLSRWRHIDPALPAPPTWALFLTLGFEADGS